MNEQCICTPNNITIIPVYHIRDSTSYHIVRCNYCGEEWAEFWISYKYVFTSMIDHSQKKNRVEMSYLDYYLPPPSKILAFNFRLISEDRYIARSHIFNLTSTSHFCRLILLLLLPLSRLRS